MAHYGAVLTVRDSIVHTRGHLAVTPSAIVDSSPARVVATLAPSTSFPSPAFSALPLPLLLPFAFLPDSVPLPFQLLGAFFNLGGGRGKIVRPSGMSAFFALLSVGAESGQIEPAQGLSNMFLTAPRPQWA
jgi:hypothetical protein